jgi:hypothetical protein
MNRVFGIDTPIIVVCGEHGSGKTILGYSIDPKNTVCYDNELSGSSYAIDGLERIDVPRILRERNASTGGAWKPIQLYEWWLADMRKRVVAGKYSVCMIDTIEELEQGMADWVYRNHSEFGKTQVQYDKGMGLFWGDVKQLETRILTELASRVQVLYITAHMGDKFVDGRPSGERKAKGKDTLKKLASLYLRLDRPFFRKRVGDREVMEQRAEPRAWVEKQRLTHFSFSESGELIKKPILPPYMECCTPAILRKYMEKPADYDHLKKHEQAPAPEAPSELETLEIRRIAAEAEKAAADSRNAYLTQVRAMKAEESAAVGQVFNAQAAAALVEQAQTAPAVITSHPEPVITPPSPRSGVEPERPAIPPPSEQQLADLTALSRDFATAGIDWQETLDIKKVKELKSLNGEQMADLIVALRQVLHAKHSSNGAAETALLATTEQIEEMNKLREATGYGDDKWQTSLAKRNVSRPEDLPHAEAEKILDHLRKRPRLEPPSRVGDRQK